MLKKSGIFQAAIWCAGLLLPVAAFSAGDLMAMAQSPAAVSDRKSVV
jgi:hypothetical protein